MVIGIAIVILTLGVGALFLLVCRLTVDALPAFAGCAAGFWAYGTGAGPIGAIAIGVATAAVTLATGRFVFGCSRSAAIRACIAFAFAAPAAYVGYVVPAVMLRRLPSVRQPPLLHYVPHIINRMPLTGPRGMPSTKAVRCHGVISAEVLRYRGWPVS